jgi:hypothetical protein
MGAQNCLGHRMQRRYLTGRAELKMMDQAEQHFDDFYMEFRRCRQGAPPEP